MNKINRRVFLKTFSSAFSAAAIKPTQAVAVSKNLYLNQALGIAIRKPSNWSFDKIRNFEEIKSSQVLSDHIDPALEKEIRNQTDPVVVFGLNINEAVSFSPSAAFYAEHIELSANENIEDVIGFEESLYTGVLPDYKLKNATEDLSISDFKSVRLESEFTFEAEKISPILIRNTSVITRRHPFIYTLRVFDSPWNSMDAERETTQIIKNLYYS
jgi:hypothetical protein